MKRALRHAEKKRCASLHGGNAAASRERSECFMFAKQTLHSYE